MKTTVLTDHLRNQFGDIYTIVRILRELDPDMSMNQVLVFCWVVLNEGKTQRDLRAALEIPPSTASRNLAALSKVHRLRKPGLDLVEWVECPRDRRANVLFLTTRGRRLVDQLLDRLK